MTHGAWRWDETLYEGSAAYYAAGRLPYPPEVAEALQRELALDGTQRLLDIGCGPGSLTLLLAPCVRTAVAIDADADMIAVARIEAARRRVTSVEWRHMRAEELPADLGRFGLVTFAQSFHWLDRSRVAAAVRGMLEADGTCVHVQATTHRGDASVDRLSHPRPPHRRITELVASYLGSTRRAGRGSLPAGTPSAEDEVFRAAGFHGPQRVEIGTAREVTRTADEVVAAVFSLSSAAPHLFGSRLRDFERDLRALLGETASDGVYAERSCDTALDIWRQ